MASTTRTDPGCTAALATTGSPPSSLATALAPKSSALSAWTWLPVTWPESLLPTVPALNPLAVNTFDTAAASPLMSVSLSTLAVVFSGA
ncbi:hypothetical protein C1Y40_05578 [Mycobacterium talmoniae]|uniref:Uncharacterized protein n=1 Tax=Mycobacterium talmoniae TaxID=1858794 RepID=A0A2S8BC81_9MYCO|nr:hypothetical protein C1Y40_05578 [Mycobacterium talmoniae]